MADKHHAAKDARKHQRELEIRQKESLGLRTDSEVPDFERAAICFIDKSSVGKEDTIEQNGRIKSVKASLDKESPKHKEYDEMLRNNYEYIKQVGRFE